MSSFFSSSSLFVRPSPFFFAFVGGRKKKKKTDLAPGALDVERQHAQRRQARPLPLGRVRDQVLGVDVRLDLAVRRRRVGGGRGGMGGGGGSRSRCRRRRSVEDADADPSVGPEAVLPLRQRHPAPPDHALVDHEPQRVEHVGLVGQEGPRPHAVGPEGQAGLHDAAGRRDEVGRRERDSQKRFRPARGVAHDGLFHLHGHGEAEAGLLPAVAGGSGPSAHGADALGEAALVDFFFVEFPPPPSEVELLGPLFSFSSLSLSQNVNKKKKTALSLSHVERPAQPVAVVGPEVGRGLDVKVRVEAVDKRRDRRAVGVDAEHAQDRRLGEVAPGAQALVRGQSGVVDLDLLEGC